MNLAIVIGVDQYSSSSFNNLPACKNDALAVKAVLENVKPFQEILFLGDNEPGTVAKQKIVNFVEKYKGKVVDELTFYFSGHGERIDNDFFYIFSDFEHATKENTGLRNSSLDEWIKALSPKLFIKIIDACFSGTKYIKSSSISLEINLEKSAKEHEFKDIYFWCSSRENEPSYAGVEFSVFTESMLTAIADKTGSVAYTELMAKVGDDFSSKNGQAPVCITQAGHTEKFGDITKNTQNIIYEFFGIDNSEPEQNTKNTKNTKKILPKNKILVTAAVALSCLIISTLIEEFAKNNQAASSAFKNYYIPFTKKGEQCLDTDQELQRQSALLAGTMILARKELSRIAQEDFNIGPGYEPIIKTVIQNFSDAQKTQVLALNDTNACWNELKRLIGETSVAAGIYNETKAVDPILTQKESDLNKSEQELRTKFIDPINAENLYEGFVKMASTKDTNKLRELLTSFDKDFESLILFREGMVDLTAKRIMMRQEFYMAKKDMFSKLLSSNMSIGFFKKP
jgi:hypothetical protein